MKHSVFQVVLLQLVPHHLSFFGKLHIQMILYLMITVILMMNRLKITTLIFISHCILGPRLQYVVLFVPLCSSVQHINYHILQLEGFLGFLSSCVLHQTFYMLKKFFEQFQSKYSHSKYCITYENLLSHCACINTSHSNIYHRQKFGGRKVWRIWQILPNRQTLFAKHLTVQLL